MDSLAVQTALAAVDVPVDDDHASASVRGDSTQKKPQQPQQPPLGFAWRSSNWFIIFTVSVAVFTDIFLYGLIVPVFPFALEEQIGTPAEDVQKWVSILMAVFGAGLLAGSPICGYIADRTKGRLFPFIAGLVALAASTVMLCVGTNVATFVMGRLFQGISAAIVWTVGLALLADTVGRDQVGQAMGTVGLAMSLAMFTAPLLGGIVFERGGYYAVFAMAFGTIGIDIILRLLIIEKKDAAQYLSPLDTHSERGRDEASSIKIEPEAQESEVATPEKRRAIFGYPVPRLPPVVTLLGHSRLLCSLWGSLMQALLITAAETTVPLFVHETFNFGSTGAGLVFLALVVPSFLGPVIGKICDRYGPRLMATLGFLVGGPFFFLLRLPDENDVKDIVVFCMLLTLAGAAMAMVYAPLLVEITYVILDLEAKKPGRFGPKGAFAQAYGLFNLAFAGGSLVGPLLAGLLKASNGWKTMTLVLGLLCGATAIPTFIYTGGKLKSVADIRLSKLTTVAPAPPV